MIYTRQRFEDDTPNCKDCYILNMPQRAVSVLEFSWQNGRWEKSKTEAMALNEDGKRAVEYQNISLGDYFEFL